MTESSAGSPAPSLPPIGSRKRRTVTVQPWDPRVVEVAPAVIALVRYRRPDAPLDPVFYQAAKGGWMIDTDDRLGIARPRTARRPQEADR